MFDQQSYSAVVEEARRHVSSPILYRPYKREIQRSISNQNWSVSFQTVNSGSICTTHMHILLYARSKEIK